VSCLFVLHLLIDKFVVFSLSEFYGKFSQYNFILFDVIIKCLNGLTDFLLMDNRLIVIILCLLYGLMNYSCDRNDDDIQISPDSYITYFESLTAEKDTISRGESTTITAKVAGKKITYIWTASEGPVIGEGSQVIYLSSACCYGNVKITCEARAKNGSESKSLIITVLK